MAGPESKRPRTATVRPSSPGSKRSKTSTDPATGDSSDATAATAAVDPSLSHEAADFFERQIVELKQKLEEARSGKSPEYLEKCAALDRETQKEISAINAYVSYQRSCLEKMHAYDKSAAEECNRVAKADFLGDLTKSLEDDIARLQKAASRNRAHGGPNRRLSKRNLRSKSERIEEAKKGAERMVHDGGKAC